MTAPGVFGLTEVTEAEGLDLGTVSLAGVRRTCESCGRDSYTGPRCTACAVRGAPGTRFAWASEGVRPRGPEIASDRVAIKIEFLCGSGECMHEMPGSAQDLQRWAVLNGWSTGVRHSRGTPAGARTVKDVWSVRFRRPGWMGYAVRAGDSWTSVCVAGDSLHPFLDLGVTELREWLTDPEREADWYAGLKQRRAAQALAARTRACPGPGRCPWVDGGRGEHTHRANGDIKIKRSRAERVDGG